MLLNDVINILKDNHMYKNDIFIFPEDPFLRVKLLDESVSFWDSWYVSLITKIMSLYIPNILYQTLN